MDVVNKKETTIYKRYSELKALDKQVYVLFFVSEP